MLMPVPCIQYYKQRILVTICQPRQILHSRPFLKPLGASYLIWGCVIHY